MQGCKHNITPERRHWHGRRANRHAAAPEEPEHWSSGPSAACSCTPSTHTRIGSRKPNGNCFARSQQVVVFQRSTLIIAGVYGTVMDQARWAGGVQACTGMTSTNQFVESAHERRAPALEGIRCPRIRTP